MDGFEVDKTMLLCAFSFVEETLVHLQQAGRVGVECIVLWLGVWEGDDVRVVSVYRPKQAACRDQFLISPEEMASIMELLRERRWMIAAQVHSHPLEAFHSIADDEGAIVRHQEALSFVVPWFAAKTSVKTFLRDVALYRLEAGDRWLEVVAKETSCTIKF
jgi:hypothetical protein